MPVTTRGRVSSARVRGARAPSLRTALFLPAIRLLGMGIMERICNGLTAVYFVTFLQSTYHLTLNVVTLPLAVRRGRCFGWLSEGPMSRRSPTRYGWNTRTFSPARSEPRRPPPTTARRCWQPLRRLDGGSKSTTDGGPICAIQATIFWLSWQSRAQQGRLSATMFAPCDAASYDGRGFWF